MTVGSRSIRMMAILFVFNSILAAVALFNMYSVAEQVRTTAEIQYSQFLDLYTFVSSIEFIMLLFIMPALTASSISGERERQTLERRGHRGGHRRKGGAGAHRAGRRHRRLRRESRAGQEQERV